MTTLLSSSASKVHPAFFISRISVAPGCHPFQATTAAPEWGANTLTLRFPLASSTCSPHSSKKVFLKHGTEFPCTPQKKPSCPPLSSCRPEAPSMALIPAPSPAWTPGAAPTLTPVRPPPSGGCIFNPSSDGLVSKRERFHMLCCIRICRTPPSLQLPRGNRALSAAAWPRVGVPMCPQGCLPGPCFNQVFLSHHRGK